MYIFPTVLIVPCWYHIAESPVCTCFFFWIYIFPMIFIVEFPPGTSYFFYYFFFLDLCSSYGSYSGVL